MTDSTSPSGKPSLLQVVGSVLAAAVGIQTNANRERDFKSGSATTYIVAGFVFTVVFILAIITVVNLVLKSAGH